MVRSFQDLLPIILVIALFQIAVLGQGVPQLGKILAGGLMVLVGLTLFVQGLQMALFPLGEDMAYSFVRKGNLWLLLLFYRFFRFIIIDMDSQMDGIAIRDFGRC